MKTALITATGHDFGSQGYPAYGRIQLPGMGGPATQAAAEDPAANFRRGILFLFGNCTLQTGLTDALSELETGEQQAEGLADAVTTARQHGFQLGAELGQSKSIGEQIASTLGKVSKYSPAVAVQAFQSASDYMRAQLPDLIQGLLGQVASLGVPVLKEARSFVTNLASAIGKTRQYWDSRGLGEVLREGHPQIIVEALRQQIGKDALLALAKAILDAAKVVAGAITGGAATVGGKLLGAIVGFLKFVWELFQKVKDYFLLRSFFADCKAKLRANSSVITDLAEFKPWFSGYVDDLPVVPSYCLCSHITGSYFGFLTAVSSDGTDISGKRLKKLHDRFGSLGKPAAAYVKDYSKNRHKFSSSDPIVKQTLEIIEQGSVDLTDGAAAESRGWFRRFVGRFG